MSIALSEEHQELARVARAFLASQDARGESRALLEAPADRLPQFWKEMAELGWMGLHASGTRNRDRRARLRNGTRAASTDDARCCAVA
jgi:alkylation response protein AidB-like acyl-CoA dehydrogenase